MTDRAPRVYLICQPSVKRDGSTPDLRALARHGEVVVLLDSGRRVTVDPVGSLAAIEEKL